MSVSLETVNVFSRRGTNARKAVYVAGLSGFPSQLERFPPLGDMFDL